MPRGNYGHSRNEGTVHFYLPKKAISLSLLDTYIWYLQRAAGVFSLVLNRNYDSDE